MSNTQSFGRDANADGLPDPSPDERQAGLREALDRMVDEVREGTRTLSDAYRDDADGAKRWRAAVDRIHLAVAEFALAAQVPAQHRPSAVFEDGSPPVCVVDDETWPCRAAPAQEERLDVESAGEPHPNEHHDFRTTCARCGEPGFIITLVTPGEQIRVEPVAAEYRALTPRSPG